MGQTIAEKVFSRKAGKQVKAGEVVLVEVDMTMGQDGTSPLAIKAFEEMGGKKLFDPQRVVLVIDHNSPAPLMSVANIHKLMMDFANRYGARLYMPGEGICHQIMPERGHVAPGEVVIGADSHTTTYGAINAFSTGVGSTDLAAAWITGKMWFRVPESVKIVFKGKIPRGVFSKDMILYAAGQLGADWATYRSIEFTGEAISELSVDARLTISNMAVELGAKAGIMEADEKTIEWVKGRVNRKFEPVSADPDAEYEEVVEFDVSKIGPQVAVPHAVDNVKPIEEVEGTPIQEAFLGTCTNGRVEDLEVAARIVAGKRVAPGVKFIVAPASKHVFIEAMKKGIVQTLIEAGAVFVAPGCGACVGTHNGVPADGENVISSANRNFKGRMGNPNAFIYLGSPATVAASAVEGKITDPRKYL